MKEPYTLDQLREHLPELSNKLKKEIEEIEEEDERIRPLPPMTTDECLELLFRLVEIAKIRTFDCFESTLFGQLLANYRMAVQAETLGKRGRYYVMSEEDIQKIVAPHLDE